MSDPQPPFGSQKRGLSLPAFERLAPPPTAGRLDAEIEARTSAGDVVLELHGRGGWVARAAIDRLRRAFAIETTSLTRLVAEVVLRPPDVRHLDAAFSAMAVDTRGMEGGLRPELERAYASRCAGCGGPVVVEEYIWEAEATDPSRKSYRCARCRDGRSDGRPVDVDAADLSLARGIDATAARQVLRSRFPAPASGHPLPEELVDLYPPRAQVALAAILERIETDLRAASIQAALRLAVVHIALSVSRLNGYPGRVAQPRVVNGRLRPSGSRQWRERNVWAAFEEGYRAVRDLVATLGNSGPRTPSRVGPDLRALLDGSANVALRFGEPTGPETFGPPPRPGEDPGPRPRIRPAVRLVLSQPPIHWSPDNLAFAYLASALAIGPEGAASLPLAALFGPGAREGWGRDAATLRRALSAVRPVLLPEAEAVIVLEAAGPEALVAMAVGGVGAGYQLADAVLGESGAGLSGTLRFGLPRTPAAEAGQPPRPASERSTPFQVSVVERTVSDIAVAVIQLRGEPAPFARILSEVLLGLDRAGHLRRLVGARAPLEVEPTAEEGTPAATVPRAAGLFGEAAPDAGRPVAPPPGRDEWSAAGPGPVPSAAGAPGRTVEAGPAGGPPARAPGSWEEPDPVGDPVRLTLDLVTRELRRPDHRRLLELEEGLRWLRDEQDVAAAKAPLAERLEWGVFSLLTTSGGISEASFRDRIGRLFRGPETADDELVAA